MSRLFGALQLSDSDRALVKTIGVQVVFDAAKAVVEKHNADMQKAYSMFVGETTEDYKRRYKLPGSGYLQNRSEFGRPGAVKAYGQWDVAFPLYDKAAAIANNDIQLAYMTLQEMDRHLETVLIQDVNTTRHDILVALFNNTNLTYKDDIWGDLNCVPLANGDAVVYPPLPGVDAEATDDHYLESGYDYTAISDTNDPIKTIKNELAEHTGNDGSENIVVFINSAETPYVEELTDFVEVDDKNIRAGANMPQLYNLPNNLPGRLIGRCDGCWISEWAWMPAHYMIGEDMSQTNPKPLIRRVDPKDTGLGQGLVLVAKDNVAPFEEAFWRNRQGFGVGNRLNGVVMELGTGGTYTIPAAYAR